MNKLEFNKVHCGDCISLLNQLEDESIDIIITSPPYNKGRRNGKIVIDYDKFTDDLEEEVYQNNQVEWLSIAYKKLKCGGSLFYNHKERTNHKGGSIRPDEWLCRTPFKDTIRQMIIWDRVGSENMCGSLCGDQMELIYWMTKPDKKGNIRINKQKFMDEKGKLVGLTNIWKFNPEKDKAFKHPAPYPIGLPLRCLHLILGQPQRYSSDKPCVVLDPYFGTGTTGMAASLYKGVSWLGFDIDEGYAEKSQSRLDEFMKTQNTFRKKSIWDY